MVDEEQLSDVDARLRAALLPNHSATRRVLLAALSDQTVRLKPDTTGATVRRPSALIASRRLAIAAAALLMLALGVGVSIWRRHAAAPVAPAMTSLKITSHGSLIVVEGADGRRWIVGPAMERRAEGHYVIVISE